MFFRVMDRFSLESKNVQVKIKEVVSIHSIKKKGEDRISKTL